MFRTVKSIVLLFVLPATLLVVGCSKPTATLVPAQGVITIGGKPAGNISIQFMPDVKENAEGVWPSSMAISDAEGRFELSTIESGPGAVPGQHKVVLSDLEEERPEQGKERTKPVRLSSNYAIVGKLSANVEVGKTIEIKIP